MGKVVDLDLVGLSLRVPCAPTLTALAHQFFLLGIDGYYGLPLPLEGLRPPVDVLELGISIRMGTARQRFAVGLETVAEVMEESIHRPLTHHMPLSLEGRGHLGCTLAGPPQERHGVAHGGLDPPRFPRHGEGADHAPPMAYGLRLDGVPALRESGAQGQRPGGLVPASRLGWWPVTAQAPRPPD